MLKLFLIFLLLISQSAISFEYSPKDLARPIKRMSDIKRLLSKYPKNRTLDLLRDFVNCCRPNRYVGTVGHGMAAPFLIDKIKSLSKSKNAMTSVDSFEPDVLTGIKMFKDDFKNEVKSIYKESDPEFKKWDKFTKMIVSELMLLKGLEGKNVIWESKGAKAPKETLIIGGHFDSIHLDSKEMKIIKNSSIQGADDNGTGVAMMLSLIEILSQLELPKSVRIVFFDFQEMGYLGSLDFVRKYKQELKENLNFSGFINLLMLGHDTKKHDTEGKLRNFKMYLPKKSDSNYELNLEFAQNLQKAGDRISPTMNFALEPNGFNMSDHIRFWEEGFPGVVFSQNWETDFNAKKNHTTDDFVETLNFETIDKAFDFVAGAVLSWAYDLDK